MSARVSIITLGCRVNQAESSTLEGTLRHHKIDIVPLEEHPDFCIINTCTVTARADANSRQLIRKVARTGAQVIVTGCYSQLNRDTVQLLGGVSHVVPIAHKERIPEIILGRSVDAVHHLHGVARPLLKVQDGCNLNCSYCAVARARGKSRSLLPELAIRRAQEIESSGYHEIVLTGVHLGSYGRDLPVQSSLAQLIELILQHTGLSRIRISSLEVTEITDHLLNLLSDPRICRHLHIPLQSGSDNILRAMRRTYSAGVFSDRVAAIAARIGDIAIGSDVIAGFPGESPSDHSATLSICRDLPIAYLHVFPFSIREGTKAADIRPKVTDAVITDRASDLQNLSSQLSAAFSERHVGRTLDIIVEELDDRGLIVGRAGNYLKISAPSSGIKRGSLVLVRSVSIEKNSLRGFVLARQ